MADIFISYSKKDAGEARLVAALLEAQGYSVWWDANLETGDEFRPEITEQLDAAKAVIALWTENSVKSVWVNAEASRAHSDRKLVPLKARLLPGDQIPLPFSELHTTNFDNHEAVLAAVKTQLAKPPAPPAVWKKVRYEALTWFGIIGSAITIAGNFSSFLKLANWLRSFTHNFSDVMVSLWSALASIMHLKVSLAVANLLSLFLFFLSLILGSIVLAKGTRKRFSKLQLSAMLFSIASSAFASYLVTDHNFNGYWPFVWLTLTIVFSLSVVEGGAAVRILVTIENLIYFFGVIYLFKAGGTLLEFDSKIIQISVLSAFFFGAMYLPLILVPTYALAKRLSLTFVTVALIFGLSEVSKLVEQFSVAATQAK